MKYGKLINNNLDIKEVEEGIEVGGTTTEQQLKEQGYKPVCEVEEPEGSEYFVYREYDACFVQEWRMKDEPLQEGDIWTSDSGVDPTFNDIKRVKKDLMYIESEINTYNLTSTEALEVKEMYPKWESGLSVNVGERYLYEDTLWEVIQTHTTQDNWKPSISTASLWKTVDVEHEGTLEDPIIYTPPMEIFKDKYYIEDGIKYKCTRNSDIPLTHKLSTLVGQYVEKS